MARSSQWRSLGALTGFVLAVGLAVAPAGAQVPIVTDPDVFDCTVDLGDPEPGTPQWDFADQNNRWCAQEGPRTAAANPAFEAARAANVAQGSAGVADPFRELIRWAGIRGVYREVTWTDRNGLVHAGSLWGPLDAARPSPGVVVPCHTCNIGPAGTEPYFWATEALAEHGYLVFFPDIGGNSIPGTIDATDYFLATPDHPTVHGEFNPWWELLDRRVGLGIAGHSGAAVVALTVGNTDPRYDAVMGFDRARSADGLFIDTIAPRMPTMIQVADYFQDPNGVTVPQPYATRPVPAPGSKFTDFEAFRDAGVDSMHVSLRASTHAEWTAPVTPYQPNGGSLYGERLATYYTLAWFDRFLRGAVDPGAGAAALQRLTATGTFDGSADVHSIGAGTYDAVAAAAAGSIEAGNVPVMIEGRSVRNRLSYLYLSRYFLEGGALDCEDLRAGCP